MNSPAQLLREVNDRESFIAFVRALADERRRAEEIEKTESKRYSLDGASNWKNADISSFLYAGLDCFTEKPLRSAEKEPSWKAFAHFPVLREDHRMKKKPNQTPEPTAPSGRGSS